jgi:hypothetical protein
MQIACSPDWLKEPDGLALEFFIRTVEFLLGESGTRLQESLLILHFERNAARIIISSTMDQRGYCLGIASGYGFNNVNGTAGRLFVHRTIIVIVIVIIYWGLRDHSPTVL